MTDWDQALQGLDEAPGSAAPTPENPPPATNGRSQAGLLEAGNIDLAKRPVVKNPDGSISTVRSIDVFMGDAGPILGRPDVGPRVVLPTIGDDGREMSPEEAIENFKSTGRHLGKFDTPENATIYAQSLHQDQARMYGKRSKWDAELAALDANQLLQENPGFTGVLKEGFKSLGRGGLRGLAETLGTPVDTLNAVSDFIKDYPTAAAAVSRLPGAGGVLALGAAKNAATDEKIEAGSSGQIKRGIESTGLSTKKPQELGITDSTSHWMDTIGEFGGANLPFAGLGLAKAGGQTALKTVGTLLKEIGIGGVAPGTMAVLGEEAAGPEHEDIGRTVGALAGNLRYKVLDTALKAGKTGSAWMHDFLGFGTGAKTTAGKALATVTQDLPAATTALREPVDLSPGARVPVDLKSGDEGLIALRQSVAARDAKLSGDYQAMQRATEEALLLDAKLSPSNFPDTESWLKARQWALEQMASRRMIQAVDEAEVAAERAVRGVETVAEDATVAKNQQARYLRAELLNAQDDLKAVVDTKWDKVDKNLPVDMAPVYDRIRTLQAEHAGREGQGGARFPSRVINRFFGEAEEEAASGTKALADAQWGKTSLEDIAKSVEGTAQKEAAAATERFGPGTTLQTVIDLDSQVQQELRIMAGTEAPDAVYMAYLKRLSEALNEAKYSVPDASPALKDAVSASKSYHDMFTRGPVGKVLGYDRAGGADVAPGQTIKQFLSQGPGGVDSFNQLMKAVQARTGQVAPIHESAVMPELLQKYIRQDFFDKVMPNGQFNLRAAEKWMSNNAGPMQHFPQLRDEINTAIRTQGQAVQAAEHTKQTLDEVRNSRAALFLDGNPGRLFNGAVEGPNQLAATRELIAATRNDPTGRATEGLVQMALDRMIADAIVPDRSSTILRRTNGLKIKEWVEQHEGVIRALDEAVPGVRSRFDRIANTADYLERFQVTSKMPTPEQSSGGGWVRQVMARIAGANVFSKFAGGGEGASLQTAAIGSQAFKKIAEALTPDQATALIRRALVEPDLFELLTKNWNNATPQKQAEAVKRLSPYLYSIGIPLSQPILNPPPNQQRERAQSNRSSAGPSDWPSLGVP